MADASLYEQLLEAQRGGDHSRIEELLFANSSAVLALIEAAQRGKLAWEKTVAQLAPGKDPWTLEFATQESLDLIAALAPFEEVPK